MDLPTAYYPTANRTNDLKYLFDLALLWNLLPDGRRQNSARRGCLMSAKMAFALLVALT